MEAMKALSEKGRAALVLIDIEGLSSQEAAWLSGEIRQNTSTPN